jgi:hypothetical protein
LDWSKEAVWIAHAPDALNLNSGLHDEWDKAVRKAFKDFGLDPKNPYDWRILLSLYVSAHARRGRPPEWNSENLCKLLRQVSKARQKRPNAKASEIFRSLVRPKAAYFGKTEDYLKHGYRLALDLERNEILRTYRDLVAKGYLDVLRAGYREKGWPITVSDERGVRNSDYVLDDALELIGAPLGRWRKK